MIKIAKSILGFGSSNWKALLTVFAFTCAVSLAVGAYQMGKQGERLETVAAQNKGLRESLDRAEKDRVREMAHSIELQEKLTIISTSSDEANRRLRELEKSNAEVKEFLNRSTPTALRGLLTQQSTGTKNQH